MSGKKWTIVEKNFLVEHRPDYSLAEMATRVGHPKSSVLDKIHDLGYTWRRKKQEQRKLWTPNEEQFLKENYGKISTRKIAKKLDRTLYSVRDRIEVLNLWRRTKEEISQAPEFHLIDTEAAYIAGIIDGEGCLSIHLTWGRNRSPFAGTTLGISNTDLRLIEWIRDKLKINHKYSYRDRKRGSKRTYSLVTGHRNHLKKIIQKIQPYLIVKEQLAVLFLQILELKKKGALNSELLQTILEFKKLQDVRNGKQKVSTQKLREFITGLPKDI